MNTKKTYEEIEKIREEFKRKVKNAPQTPFFVSIGQRLAELIKRDPLANKLTSKIKENLPLLKRKIETDVMTITLDDTHYAYCSFFDIPEELFHIAQEFENKWLCRIRTTLHRLPSEEDSKVSKFVPICEYWGVCYDAAAPVEIPIDFFISNDEQYWDLSIGGVPKTYPKHKLPILIDLSVIDLNDAKKIKKLVWEEVKNHLKQQRQSNSSHHSAFPPELNFIYHIKEETFKNYLRWYDLHVEERFSYRAIALLENRRRTDPTEATKLIEKLKHEKKQYRHGEPVDGEKRIENGIKTIYKAIHRTEYTRKNLEPLIDEYNCPEHGNDCPESCDYYKNWLNRFNRLNPAY